MRPRANTELCANRAWESIGGGVEVQLGVRWVVEHYQAGLELRITTQSQANRCCKERLSSTHRCLRGRNDKSLSCGELGQKSSCRFQW